MLSELAGNFRVLRLVTWIAALLVESVCDESADPAYGNGVEMLPSLLALVSSLGDNCVGFGKYLLNGHALDRLRPKLVLAVLCVPACLTTRTLVVRLHSFPFSPRDFPGFC
jgi:hypothetical protein